MYPCWRRLRHARVLERAFDDYSYEDAAVLAPLRCGQSGLQGLDDVGRFLSAHASSPAAGLSLLLLLTSIGHPE